MNLRITLNLLIQGEEVEGREVPRSPRFSQPHLDHAHWPTTGEKSPTETRNIPRYILRKLKHAHLPHSAQLINHGKHLDLLLHCKIYQLHRGQQEGHLAGSEGSGAYHSIRHPHWARRKPAASPRITDTSDTVCSLHCPQREDTRQSKPKQTEKHPLAIAAITWGNDCRRDFIYTH